MTVTLTWEGELPANIEAVATQVMIELGEMMPDLDHTPANLMIHTVQLTTDHEGPTVLVSGREGDDRFFCTYYETMRWRDVGRTEAGRTIVVPDVGGED